MMLKTIVISILVASMTTACGFHLRGQNPQSQAGTQAVDYARITLDIPTEHKSFAVQLHKQLIGNGIQLDQNDSVIFKLDDYQFRRQQLNGKLTEVLLQLNVRFYLTDQNGKMLTQPRTVRAYRNYQYDIETVNTENQQEQYLKQTMIDDVAQQITNQIINNRLVKAK